MIVCKAKGVALRYKLASEQTYLHIHEGVVVIGFILK